MTRSEWFSRVRELTLRLVAWESVSGTEGEQEFAFRLHDLLRGLPYFATHPEYLQLRRTQDDPLERYTLFALVRGKGPRTVILTGHYDVVSVDNYGLLKEWAFDPEELLPKLLEEIRTSNPQAAQDLASGDFLPGRAALDMKSGLAAGIAVLERFATSEPVGNLLFIAVPDEEHSSHGMRSAVQQLPELLGAWGLEAEAAINLDAHVDTGDGSEGQNVFLGSVGKLLPTVFFLGSPTHAGDPFSGVGANFLAAELIRLLEANPDFADAEAPPPVNLRQGDFKDYYDVTTPHTAFAAFNLLTHTWGPREVLERVVAATHQALESALETLRARAARRGLRVPERRPMVLTFAELERWAREKAGRAVQEAYQGLKTADPLEFSRQVTERLVRQARLEGPAAVVGFGSLYYPRARLGESPGEKRLLEIVSRQATQVSQEFGTPIGLRPFFPGISDMSFLGCRDTKAALEAMAANTPAFGKILHFDYRLPAQLAIPVVNLGPWGRDYHQRTERVHMPYSFGVLPELLWRVCRDLLT